MAKKKIEVFIYTDNTKDFEKLLHKHENDLICAEIFNGFAGPCRTLDRFCQVMKLDWSDGKMIMLRVLADDIAMLKRFHGHSEPIFLFITNHRITKVVRGVDAIKFEKIAKDEIKYFNSDVPVERTTFALDEASPDEVAWLSSFHHKLEHEASTLRARRAARQAARKAHRAGLLVPHLEKFNFVLFWPHCKHAHPELYERWDANGIIMIGREEVQLSEDEARDVLYAGDAPVNEASLLALTASTALAICFRCLQDNVHFVSLVRRILYEDLPVFEDGKPASEQTPRKTAYDLYKTYSKSKEQILTERMEIREQKKLELQEKRARRLSEMQRLARQKIEEAIEKKRQMREQKKLELLRTGQLEELKKLKLEPEDDSVSIEIPEELEDEVEEEESDDDDEEYFPPPGLEVPGFYAPPNDIAKANGLAILFPKVVNERVEPLAEFLPPHVLVIISIYRRHKFIDSMTPYQNSIIHMGIFKGSGPTDAKHVAYNVKEFDKMGIDENLDQYKVVLMVSVERDSALLELMDLFPLHVSRDLDLGGDEAHDLFPVHYADRGEDKADFTN